MAVFVSKTISSKTNSNNSLKPILKMIQKLVFARVQSANFPTPARGSIPELITWVLGSFHGILSHLSSKFWRPRRVHIPKMVQKLAFWRDWKLPFFQHPHAGQYWINIDSHACRKNGALNPSKNQFLNHFRYKCKTLKRKTEKIIFYTIEVLTSLMHIEI